MKKVFSRNNFINAETGSFLWNESKEVRFYDTAYGSDNKSMLTSSLLKKNPFLLSKSDSGKPGVPYEVPSLK